MMNVESELTEVKQLPTLAQLDTRENTRSLVAVSRSVRNQNASATTTKNVFNKEAVVAAA
jgi:hypothetical protein